MDEEPYSRMVICCSGDFEEVRGYGHDLNAFFSCRVENSVSNNRIVAVSFHGEPSRRVVAVSSHLDPHAVFVDELPNPHPISSSAGEMVRLSAFPGHTCSVEGLAAVPSTLSSHPLIISGGNGDGLLLVSDAETGEKLSSFPDPPHNTFALDYVPEWDGGIVVGLGHPIYRYDLARCDGHRLGEEGDEVAVIDCIACVPLNAFFTVSNAEKLARLWSSRTESCQTKIDVCAPSSCCYYSEFHNYVLVGSCNGLMQAWDLRRMDRELNRIDLSGEIYVLEQIDEDLFVSGSSIGNLQIWRQDTGSIIHSRNLSHLIYGCCVFESPLENRRDTDDAQEERISFLLDFEYCPQLLVLALAAESVSFWKWIANAPS